MSVLLPGPHLFLSEFLDHPDHMFETAFRARRFFFSPCEGESFLEIRFKLETLFCHSLLVRTLQ